LLLAFLAAAPFLFFALGASMQDRKTIILAQFFISLMMCFLMTGYASVLQFGIDSAFIGRWAYMFITAWPVAFILSMFCGAFGFKLANKINASRK
jgi:hypothetical protein